LDDGRRALIEDMGLALRSELGARTLYRLLRRRTSDPELRSVLERMAADERDLVPRLAALIEGLGGRARRRSFRRWLASWAIALGTLPFGLRFALRLCQDAEGAVARWYGAYRDYFSKAGDAGRARQCDEARDLGRELALPALRRLSRP
jgi:hypothetical protein